MGLPELLANSSVPGSVTSLTTLAAAITSTTATTITTAGAAPTALRGTGQFRIVVGSEIMLVTGGTSGTSWTVERGAEGTTAATHLTATPVFHFLTVGAVRALLEPLVASTLKPLGNVVGNVTPNLAEGRVFTMTTTGPVAIQAPSNAPVVNAALYVELSIKGNHAITVPGIVEWLGEAPEFQIGSTSSRNLIMLASYDNGTTWYGIGGETLPPNLVQAAVGAPGEVLTSTGTAYAPASPTGGVSKSEAESIATSAVSSGASLNAIRIGTGPNATFWELASNIVGPIAQGRLVVSEALTTSRTLAGPVLATGITLGSKTATVGESGEVTIGEPVTGVGIQAGTVVESIPDATHVVLSKTATKTETTLATYQSRNVFYPVTAAGITLTMPVFTLLSGTMTVIANTTSGGTVFLKGKWNPAVPLEESTIEVKGEETIVFTRDGSSVWKPYASYRSLAALEAVIQSQALTVLPSTAASGLKAQSFDLPASVGTMTLGGIHISKIMVPQTISPKELWLEVTTAGVALTSANAAIYASTGAIIGEASVSEVTPLQGIGPAKLKLKGSPTITGGPGVFIWGAILAVGGTTTPQLAAAAYGGRLRDINAALGAAEVRNGEGRNAANEATYTALPTALEPSNNVGKAADKPFFWMGLK